MPETLKSIECCQIECFSIERQMNDRRSTNGIVKTCINCYTMYKYTIKPLLPPVAPGQLIGLLNFNCEHGVFCHFMLFTFPRWATKRETRPTQQAPLVLKRHRVRDGNYKTSWFKRLGCSRYSTIL